jgi:inosose dehydratase
MFQGYCCNSGLLCDSSIEEAIDILAAEGYTGIEVSLEKSPPFLPIPAPHMSPDDSAERRAAVRDHAAQAGVTIAAVNAHTNLIAGHPEECRANLEFLKGAIGVASDIGAPCVVMGCGVKNMYGYEKDYWETAVNAYRELLAVADERGVKLTVEAGSIPGNLVRNLETIKRFLSHDGLDNVRVIFDPSHYLVRGDDVAEVFRELAPRIVHVHLKDARGNQEDFEFPPMGQGDVDFKRLLQAIVDSGYRGFLSVEYEAMAWGYPNEPRTILRESKQFIENMLASISR